MSVRVARITEQIVAAVRGFVARAKSEMAAEVKALSDRFEELDRGFKSLPSPDKLKGEPGKDAVIDFAALQAAAEQAVAKMPKPQDGKSVDMGEVRKELQTLVAAIPRPADGKSVELEALSAMIERAVAARVAEIPTPEPGQPGKDAQIDFKALEAAAELAVSKLPTPQAKEVGAEQLQAAVDAAVEKRVALIPAPKPGVDGKDVDMAEVRSLLETMFKGIPVPRDGRDVDQEAVQRQVAGLVAAELPAQAHKVFNDLQEGLAARAAALVPVIAPQRGDKGADGQDGVSIEDFDLELRDGRTVVVKIRGAERVIEKSIELDGMPMDRGLFKSGASYSKGDFVTYGGSIWACLKQGTTEPPRSSSDPHAWQLRVKGAK